MRRGRIGRVFVQAFHAHLRAVMRKLAAEHLDEFRPAVKRVARRVDADERVARLDPVQKSLHVGNRQVARRAGKNHAVIILQRLRRQFLQGRFQFFIPCGFGGVERGLLFLRRVLFQRRRESGRRMTRRLLHKFHGELTAVLRQLRQDLFRPSESNCDGNPSWS